MIAQEPNPKNPKTGDAYLNNDELLITGRIETTAYSSVKHIHYYINGIPYKCISEDFELVIQSFYRKKS